MPRTRQVVFIMTDTQRPDMLGCYGNAAMKTPCIDALAAEGMRFDQAYTCQPVCGPARSAIFTGLFPHSNGSWTNSIALSANVKTIGQRLRDHGVHTAYIGKWHLDGGDYFGTGRCPDGWDPAYWYDMRDYLEELSPEDRERSRKQILNRDPNLTEDFTFGHRCSNRAIDFLSKFKDDSFFLAVSYDEPHHPFICPKPFSEMYRAYEWPKTENAFDTLAGKPEHQRVWAEHAHVDPNAPIKRADYLGCNSYVDYEIGRMLDAVRRYAPNALIIYTSDHGDHLGAHRLTNKGATMYEENCRIPLIVRWPGVTPAGSVCSHPASHIDLTPTVMEAMGLPLPQWREGQSMLATLKNPAARANEAIFMEFARYEVDHDGFGGFQPIRCVFDGRYKLVINLLATDELYDMGEDPQEMANLIDSQSHRAIRDALHDRIIDWMNRTRDPFRGYQWQRRPWRTDAPPASWDHTGMTRQRENEEYEPRQLDYDTGLTMEQATRQKRVGGKPKSR